MFVNKRTFLIINILVFVVIRKTVSGFASREKKINEMLKYMNHSVNPCDDFYEYSCGNYKKYHKVDRIKQPIIGSLDILNLRMESNVKAILESKEGNISTKADRKVKSFYHSCLRATKLKALYKFKLKNLIREIGFMPLVHVRNLTESEFEWSEVIAKIFYISGLDIIMQIEIDSDYLDNTKNRIYLREALSKSKGFYEENLKDRHEFYINDIAENLQKFLGIKQDLALITSKEIFLFEAELAKGIADERSELPMTDMFPMISIKDLDLKYKKLWNVKKFFNLALGSYAPTSIYVQQNFIDHVLNTVYKTPKYIMANYIFYMYIKNFFFPHESSKYDFQKSCLRKTKYFFYRNLDNMIYRQYFTPQMKEIIYFIWNDIKLAFAKSLQSPRLNWIQEKTREFALNKLKALDLEILTYEENNFDKELQDLQIKDHDYVNNIKSILKLRSDQKRTKLKNNQSIENDFGEIASFTPMYMAAGHFVSVPVSHMQPNFGWGPLLPYAYNFAHLGFAMAHELLHAFDDGGRYYDSKGVYNNWWDPLSAMRLEDRIKCFSEQYKKYSIQGLPLPEMKIQSENISDNGGIHLAFAAYQKWFQNASIQQQHMEYISNSNYTRNQWFFISFAQMWCSVTHPEYLLSQLSTDTHVPDKFRVIGPLSNLEEFTQEFNCLPNSYMNPNKKCTIY